MLGSAAHADLYRWVDPESGSVKFSSTPPPWFERSGGPPVERIPFAGPAAPPPANEGLQARWRELLLAVSSQPTKERLEAFTALGAELDRVDPAGTARRREEFAATMRKIQK